MALPPWISKLKPSEKIVSAVREKTRGAFGKVRNLLKSSPPSLESGEEPTFTPGASSLASYKSSVQQWGNGAWSTFKSKLPKNMDDLKKVHPQDLMDNASKLLAQSSLGTYMRLGATAAVAYFLADTAALFTNSLIPDPPMIPPPPAMQSTERRPTLEDFAAITRRNIFSSRNIIPNDTIDTDPNGPARKTGLPLNLVGTVVMQDPVKSIAAIEDKSMNQIFPVRMEETLNSKITIKKIEHMRVTFVNTASGALEYVEIIEDQINVNVTARPSAISKGGIEKDGDNHINIERKELDKAFSNLNEILTQARAIPNFENGVPNGYKIIQIVPNSIYTKLGINEGDVLTAVNGEPMSDPGKAFQLMNELRGGSGHVELSVKTGEGKVRNLTYDIR